MPGTTVQGMSCAASTSSSSPPRPKTNGSPPFSRATRLPARARLTSSSLMRCCCAVLAGFLADEDAFGIAARPLQHPGADQAVVEDDVGLLQQLQRAQREQVRIARALHRSGRPRPGRCRQAARALARCEVRTSRASARSAAASSPRSTALATGPATSRSQKARRASAPSVRAMAARRAPRKRASAPRRAGSSASICARMRRASTGALPAELTATRIGERSMMAGKMKLESAASSTTFTGRLRSRAASETALLMARSAVAATTATASARCDAANGAARCVSSPRAARCTSCGCSSGATTLTCAPALRSQFTLRSATAPPPTTTTGRECRRRNTGR